MSKLMHVGQDTGYKGFLRISKGYGQADGLSGSEHQLLFERTRIQFPVPIWRLTTPVSGDQKVSSIHINTCRVDTNTHKMNKSKPKMIFKKELARILAKILEIILGPKLRLQGIEGVTH